MSHKDWASEPLRSNVPERLDVHVEHRARVRMCEAAARLRAAARRGAERGGVVSRSDDAERVLMRRVKTARLNEARAFRRDPRHRGGCVGHARLDERADDGARDRARRRARMQCLGVRAAGSYYWLLRKEIIIRDVITTRLGVRAELDAAKVHEEEEVRRARVAAAARRAARGAARAAPPPAAAARAAPLDDAREAKRSDVRVRADVE